MAKKVILVLAVLILAVFITGGYKKLGTVNIFSGSTDIGQDAAKAKALDFINNNLVPPGTNVEVKEFAKEGGLYRMDLNVGGQQEVTAYITQDGKKFFPEAMETEPAQKTADGQTDKPAAEAPKSDVPDVELFVMSYCPYGTQIEKGILPVLETLGNKIKFTLKFVDYSMHEKKELDENLRQYCIQKENPDKLLGYLKCFLQKGQGTETDCMKQNGIELSKISSCVADTDLKFNVSKNYADKSAWNGGQFPPFDVNKDDNTKYSVQGSPTLIINGTEMKASRDSKSLLASICSAFNNAPEECQKDLPATAPSPGFGEGTSSGAGADANCGS